MMKLRKRNAKHPRQFILTPFLFPRQKRQERDIVMNGMSLILFCISVMTVNKVHNRVFYVFCVFFIFHLLPLCWLHFVKETFVFSSALISVKQVFLQLLLRRPLLLLSSLKRPVVVVSLKLNCQRCISEVPQYKNIK